MNEFVIYLVQNADHKTVFRTAIRRNAERKLAELRETAMGGRILSVPTTR